MLMGTAIIFTNNNIIFLCTHVDNKVLAVHKREDRVGSNNRLTFDNGTDLPPFPGSVDKVTFTWLATEKEEVI